MNDLDFVTLVRSAVVFFILSLKVFALRHVIEGNESEKLRRTSIKRDYIFCTREIATVLRLDFHSGSVGRFAESLKAIGIVYLVNLNHNINWRRGGASV
jgi:hypothetical protein